jgi:hypothetical protein
MSRGEVPFKLFVELGRKGRVAFAPYVALGEQVDSLLQRLDLGALGVQLPHLCLHGARRPLGHRAAGGRQSEP